MNGLTAVEAAQRLVTQGPNELARAKAVNPLLRLLAQLKSPLILLLIGAAIVSGVLGDVAEAIAIVAIVVINAAVGYLQESRAEKAVHALRTMTAPRARVLRDGLQTVIPAREVVEGDVLVLEGGDVVAADATLHDAHSLTTLEAALTGESVPAEKQVEPAPADAPLAEQRHRVFMGTAVSTGTGRALVTGTGTRTELGRIATLLETATDEATPLQRQLERVGRGLMFMCLGVVAVVAVLGLLRGQAPLELVIASISLAVAAVPEGLPAVVTIALAVGVRRMAARHVLVRNLPAVETLGSCTVICTDKTGTLTTGVMAVREHWGKELEVLRVAASCCDAELHADGAGVGDTTELALLVAAKAKGLTREAIERDNPRVSVSPFDSTRKRMSVLRRDGVLYVKGAVDLLLPLCTSGTDGAVEANAAMAQRGLRVLGIATGTSAEESSLALVGLLGLADPPRPEAIEAIRIARSAGIRTMMITGDHPTTAAAIAKEMGLLDGGLRVEDVVRARVTPEEKLRIVRELKASGEVVAMTGDGTNDAPALKEAHIGIAMGVGGVEVAREAADMVLADDNFASIVAAVREGRGIYDNIRKTLVYLLGGNTAELLVVFTASLAGWPVALLPLHLLWINLVTDGLPALALVMDPASDESLKRPPKKPGTAMLGRAEWLRVALIGVSMAAATLVAFRKELTDDTVEHARTLAFSTLVFSQIFLVFGARSLSRVTFEVGAFTNPRLIIVAVGTSLLQVGLVLFPPTNALLQLGPFSVSVMLEAMALGLIPVTVVEVSKLVRRLFTRKTPG